MRPYAPSIWRSDQSLSAGAHFEASGQFFRQHRSAIPEYSVIRGSLSRRQGFSCQAVRPSLERVALNWFHILRQGLSPLIRLHMM